MPLSSVIDEMYNWWLLLILMVFLDRFTRGKHCLGDRAFLVRRNRVKLLWISFFWRVQIFYGYHAFTKDYIATWLCRNPETGFLKTIYPLKYSSFHILILNHDVDYFRIESCLYLRYSVFHCLLLPISLL